MKNLVPIAILLIATSPGVSQRNQPPVREAKTEIGVAYGVGSLQEFASSLADLIVTIGTGGYIVVESHGAFGPVSAAYNYYPTDLLSVGIEAGYFTVKRDYTESGSNTPTITTRDNIITVNGAVDLHWLTTGPVEFSSGVCGGVGLISQHVMDNDTLSGASAWFPSFNLGLLRVRLGKELGVFAEFGVGTRGLLVLGVNGRF